MCLLISSGASVMATFNMSRCTKNNCFATRVNGPFFRGLRKKILSSQEMLYHIMQPYRIQKTTWCFQIHKRHEKLFNKKNAWKLTFLWPICINQYTYEKKSKAIHYVHFTYKCFKNNFLKILFCQQVFFAHKTQKCKSFLCPCHAVKQLLYFVRQR